MADDLVEVCCPSCSWRIAAERGDPASELAVLVEDLSQHLIQRHRLLGAQADARADEIGERVAPRR